jgi:hypothetical protein
MGQLWQEHELLACTVAENVTDIQHWLTQEKFDREVLFKVCSRRSAVI